MKRKHPLPALLLLQVTGPCFEQIAKRNRPQQRSAVLAVNHHQSEPEGTMNGKGSLSEKTLLVAFSVVVGSSVISTVYSR